jgi:uncharacterized membrane protein
MSNGFLRGLSFGIILSTLIIYLLSENSIDDQIQADVRVLDEQSISSALKENDQTAISIEEYNQLKQIQQEYENNLNSLNKEENEANVTEQTETANEEQDKVILYTLEIKQGMTISEISNKLEDVKIISDSSDLEQFLKQKEWEASIQIGTFEITSKMTIEEIARKITRQ